MRRPIFQTISARFADRLIPQPERLGLTDSVSRAQIIVVAWLQRALVLLVSASCISSLFRSPGYNWFLDAGLYDPLVFVAFLLAFMRAKLAAGRERAVWGAFAASLAFYDIGTFVALGYRISGHQPPQVSLWTDGPFFMFYPLMWVAMTLLTRRQVRTAPKSLWLDGAIAALAVVAVSLVFEASPIRESSVDLSGMQVFVAWAYPIADLFMLAMIAGCFAFMGWRPDRVWQFLAAGVVTTAMSDAWFLVAADAYKPGTWMDIPWTAAWAFLGLAPWRQTKLVEQRAYEGWTIVVLPMVFATMALGVLIYGTIEHIATATTVLAVAAILGSLVRLGLTFNEIRALGQSRREARTDELTELGNRRYFYERGRELLHKRPDDRPLALLVIDLDRFKEINDSLGHQIGDGLLQQLGPRLLKVIGPETIIARLGGDEFAVLLDDVTESQALAVADDVIRSLDEPFVLDGVPVRITASVGISLFPDHAREPNGLLQHADVAMYSAKREHTGPQIYDPNRDSHTKERLRSIHELRRSIEHGRLVVFYQPQVEANTGALAGAEALVRMLHPTRGLVPPDLFLPLAEQAGLMRLLTDRVLEAVLDDLVRWRDAGSTPLKIAVNLSATNLLDAAFPENVGLELARRGLTADQLVFEVTESQMLSDLDRAVIAAERLRAMGAEMSLDDYGTGYASLAYLRQFPLDELKLDRSFVAGMHEDATARTFVRSAIDVAHSLGLRVVAEGIETKEIWDDVRALGGNVCQGYFFSKPLSSDDFYDKVVVRWVEHMRKVEESTH